LLAWNGTLRFQKRKVISWLGDWLWASPEGLCYMELGWQFQFTAFLKFQKTVLISLILTVASLK
jgi:hypothetical protein